MARSGQSSCSVAPLSTVTPALESWTWLGPHLSVSLVPASIVISVPPIFANDERLAGKDRLQATLESLAGAYRASLAYHEIDPDVFGEELARPAYDEVDRIALVVAAITVPR